MAILDYTLSDLRQEVQVRLNEPTDSDDLGLWTTAELNTFVNRAVLRVTMDTLFPKTETVIPSLSGMALYPLPADNLRPEFLRGPQSLQNKRLFPTVWLKLDIMQDGTGGWEMQAPSEPTNFYTFSWNNFLLWPPPNYGDGNTLHYVPVPSPLLDDTDATALPLPAQKLISIFASYLASMKSDVQKAFTFLQEYKSRLEPIRALSRHMNQSRPTVMVPSRTFDKASSQPGFRGQVGNSRRYY